MHPRDWQLINSELLEAIPACLARARGNATARALSRSDWLIRRKIDGHFLALRRADTVTELRRGALKPALLADLSTLSDAASAGEMPRPLSGLIERLQVLGLDADEYAVISGLQLVAEPSTLGYAGLDCYQRPLWLTRSAGRAWLRMRTAAWHEGVTLQAISGYRSHDYQLGIFRRKFARGLGIADILAVNAAPGYSEHHSGRALDIGTADSPPAEESFETTRAFSWLVQHAGNFGFQLSYPRGNRHGIVYEPWHWCWHHADEQPD